MPISPVARSVRGRSRALCAVLYCHGEREVEDKREEGSAQARFMMVGSKLVDAHHVHHHHSLQTRNTQLQVQRLQDPENREERYLGSRADADIYVSESEAYKWMSGRK